jgi:hypothetical protein
VPAEAIPLPLVPGGFGLDLVDGMEADRIRLGRRVALALHGQDVQELRALEVAHVLQGLHQLWQVVAVDGADVVPAQLLEEGARGHHALHVLFRALGQIPGGLDFLEGRLPPSRMAM